MLVVSLIMGLGIGCRPGLLPNAAASAVPLAQARKQHKTRLLVHGPAPQPYNNEIPPDVQRVYYTSQGRRLLAWLAVPSTPGPHPAVLFAHGGFSLGVGDFDDARPFVQAGFVVLMPTWRGENGNPGEFERYYGEVDDALAALDYLANVPGVDPKRLFAAGHSVGGTTAMLLAEMSPRLRGAASCGGFPDIAGVVARGLQLDSAEFPYDWHDPMENDLRSPGRHLRDLKCPLAVYNSDSDRLYVLQSQNLPEEAARFGKTVTVEVFSNTDHHSALAPAVEQMITVFKKE
jgi:dipeptidyl aminopeptidase/acylaminoacyl peptidase